MATRRWTLDATRGNYFNSKIHEDVIELDLSIRFADGRVERAGRYRLPMRDLAAEGFVNEHVEGGQRRYVVQINRDDAGRLTVGVRKGQHSRLDTFLTR